MSLSLVECRDVFKAHYGKALKQSERKQFGAYNVYGSSGMVGHHDQTLTQEPTIIIGRKGSVGKVTYAPYGGWTIDTAFYIELLDKNVCDLRYLYYALRKAKLSTKTITTSIPGLNRDDLYSVKIPLPPLEEQKRIAAILDKADALRRKRQKAIELTDQLLRSVFLDMFGDPVTNPKDFPMDVVGNYVDYLGDIGSNGSNAVVAENLVMSDKEDYALMVRTVNLNSNDFNENVKFVSEQTYNFFKKSKIYGGEIIMNKIGSAGQFWIMPNLNRPVSLGLNQFVIRLKNLDVNYLYYFLSTEFGKSNINNSIRGVATKSITKSAVRELPLMVPPKEKQEEFSRIVVSVKSTAERYQKCCNISDILFSSLSQRAFRDELIKQIEAA